MSAPHKRERKRVSGLKAEGREALCALTVSGHVLLWDLDGLVCLNLGQQLRQRPVLDPVAVGLGQPQHPALDVPHRLVHVVRVVCAEILHHELGFQRLTGGGGQRADALVLQQHLSRADAGLHLQLLGLLRRELAHVHRGEQDEVRHAAVAAPLEHVPHTLGRVPDRVPLAVVLHAGRVDHVVDAVGHQLHRVGVRPGARIVPYLEAPGGLLYEKIEGMAVMDNGDVYVCNDNDGVDDNSGETQLLNVGGIL